MPRAAPARSYPITLRIQPEVAGVLCTIALHVLLLQSFVALGFSTHKTRLPEAPGPGSIAMGDGTAADVSAFAVNVLTANPDVMAGVPSGVVVGGVAPFASGEAFVAGAAGVTGGYASVLNALSAGFTSLAAAVIPQDP